MNNQKWTQISWHLYGTSNNHRCFAPARVTLSWDVVFKQVTQRSSGTGPTFSVHPPARNSGWDSCWYSVDGWGGGVVAKRERDRVGVGNGKDRRRNPRHCSVFIGLSSAVRISWRFCSLPADAVLTCLATAGVARSYRDVHPKRFWPLPSSWWHGLQAGLTAMCLHWNQQYVAFLHTCNNYA